MSNYNDHYNSANWEHENRKHSHSKRRYKSRVKNRKHIVMAKGNYWTPFYVKDEVPVYDRVVVDVVPAHTEKEKAFYVVKNGTYWYTDKKGVDHYLDDYEWKETGREIFVPEKIIRRKHLVGYKSITPYVQKISLSGRKRYAKNMTHRLARRRFNNLEKVCNDYLNHYELPADIDTSKNSDHRCFDYGWCVW